MVGNGNNVYISTYNAPHTWSKKSTITLVMYVAQLCKSIFNTYPALHEKWDPEEANKDQQTSHGIGVARAKTPGGSPWTRTRTTLKNPQLATFFRIISAQQSKEVVPWRVEAGDQYNVPVSSLLEWGRNDDGLLFWQKQNSWRKSDKLNLLLWPRGFYLLGLLICSTWVRIIKKIHV